MLATVFPGQGSQAVGMGRFLFENFKPAQMLFEEAGDVLGLNLKKLCFEGPDTDLNLTENTQPALLLVSVATFAALRSIVDVQVRATAGHSIGEYAAFVTAGAMTFPDALRAVRLRGQAMQKAVPVGQGAMCAIIGLSDAQVQKLCQWVNHESGLGIVEPANFNAPGQVVVSGHAVAIDWMRVNAKPELFQPETPKLRMIPLQVSAPFHCSLMQPAELEMRSVLTKIPITQPNFQIVQNFTAMESTDAGALRENLIRQITGSVRWTECMRRLSSLGVTKVIECGHGKVLSGLLKKIDGGPTEVLNVNSLEDLQLIEKSLSGK